MIVEGLNPCAKDIEENMVTNRVDGSTTYIKWESYGR
jgi:hypothetical protein